MSDSKFIFSIVLLLILIGGAVAMYYPRNKESFKISADYFPDNAEVPVSYVPVSGLNNSYFRGGDYKDLVDSPAGPEPVKKEQVQEYYSPQQMMPDSNMSGVNQGSRYEDDDGSIPNQSNVTGINLSKHRLQADCITATFSIFGSEATPVDSVHKIYSDSTHYIPNSIITGTEMYENCKDPSLQTVYDDAMKRLEIRHV